MKQGLSECRGRPTRRERKLTDWVTEPERTETSTGNIESLVARGNVKSADVENGPT